MTYDRWKGRSDLDDWAARNHEEPRPLHCPACLTGSMSPGHTDREIRELGVALNWDDYAVCAQCYEILRAYRAIVRKPAKVEG